MITKDLDNKERQIAKVIGNSQDMNEKYSQCERVRQEALLQLEDTLQRLKEKNRDYEHSIDQLREKERLLQESEEKREDTRGRAVESIKQ